MDKRQMILERALKLFNENGIEYAGMRELAGLMGTRIGNITYYFPTKDHLVFGISQQYTAENHKIHSGNPVETLYDFLRKSQLLFQSAVKYKCLMLSMVHIMQQNPLIAEGYKKTQKTRRDELGRNLETLVANKMLRSGVNTDAWFLSSMNSLVHRFWMSEAAISGKIEKPETSTSHYLTLLAFLFIPYATVKGKKGIDRFLQQVGLEFATDK